jgi:hypothetical protein
MFKNGMHVGGKGTENLLMNMMLKKTQSQKDFSMLLYLKIS